MDLTGLSVINQIFHHLVYTILLNLLIDMLSFMEVYFVFSCFCIHFQINELIFYILLSMISYIECYFIFFHHIQKVMNNLELPFLPVIANNFVR